MYKKVIFLIPFQRFNGLHNLKNDYVQSPKAVIMYLNLNTIPNLIANTFSAALGITCSQALIF